MKHLCISEFKKHTMNNFIDKLLLKCGQIPQYGVLNFLASYE